MTISVSFRSAVVLGCARNVLVEEAACDIDDDAEAIDAAYVRYYAKMVLENR